MTDERDGLSKLLRKAEHERDAQPSDEREELEMLLRNEILEQLGIEEADMAADRLLPYIQKHVGAAVEAATKDMEPFAESCREIGDPKLVEHLNCALNTNDAEEGSASCYLLCAGVPNLQRYVRVEMDAAVKAEREAIVERVNQVTSRWLVAGKIERDIAAAIRSGEKP